MLIRFFWLSINCHETIIGHGKKAGGYFSTTIYQELYYYITSGSVLLDYLYNLMPSEDESDVYAGPECCNCRYVQTGSLGRREEENTLILCGFYYDIGVAASL